MFCGSSTVRQFQRDFPGRFSYNVFSGASIKGLPRLGSTVGHGEVIRHLARAPQRKKLFLMLGNADTDFGYYHGLAGGGTDDAAAFAAERVGIYGQFLTALLEEDDGAGLIETIGVLGLQPSPLLDAHFIDVVVGHTRACRDSLRAAGDRVDLGHAARIARVVDFNDRLAAGLPRHPKLRFFRIDHAMLDDAGSLIGRFFPSHPHEHHAVKNETFREWRQVLAPEIACYRKR
ncbi:hypothetical protein BKE38_18405 [Pseudoroseomonas deserti]|uniref:SGNH hydrolase-type esterase domain-containing protein n=2 Tax=Teichococcus deserti TaxID=1817963 RepID=A0A1V2GZ13_9PROT|nr:hypothetical protein BKE38_18405 [Pseudoroseomonas deserti]